MELDSVLTIITTVTSIITATVLIFTYRQDKKRDKPHFDLTSLNLGVPPDRKLRGIHIQNPTKPIDHCQVFCNGVALETRFGLNFQNWVYIHIGGSADFYIPDNLIDRENAIIVVKDGKKILQKAKLKDIPHAF